MGKKYNFKNSNFQEKFDELYLNNLEETINTIEYKNNENQINLYKKILLNNYSVDSDFIEKFEELITEKIELEYENAIKSTSKFFEQKNS